MNDTTAVMTLRERCALRLALIACLSASACAKHESSAELHLELSSADADVWSYQLDVEGELHEAGSLERCVVRVNRVAYPAHVLQKRSLHASVKLAPATNDIQAECRTSDGRSLRSQTLHERVRLPATPRAVARIARDSNGLFLDATGSSVSAADAAPLVRYAWYQGAVVEQQAYLGGSARLELSTSHSGDSYTLQIDDARGRSDVARVVLDADDERAVLARGAIVYGILPPLYGSPPLQRVTAALARLAELGVNTLWIAPLFTTPPNDFGYAVTDYFGVRPDYGDARDLQALIARAHALGLRVLLDLPANHTSDQHPYFVQARELHARSHYDDFYVRGANHEASHYFDWSHLPNLNYQVPEVSQFMLAVAQHWMTTFDIDGFRLDAAWGVRERAPEFWPHFAAEVRRVRPAAMLIAEASARDAYYQSPLFDAAYDWTNELGKHSWEHVFDHDDGIAARIAATLRASPDVTQAPAAAARVLRFLNNNDTGARFITRHGRALTQVATALLLTLPGIPCLYSFDEVGAEFLPYEKLLPVSHDDRELRAFHQRWIALRTKLPALTGATTAIIHDGAHDELLAYVREAGEARALVVLNFSARAQSLALLLPRQLWPTARACEVSSGHCAAIRGERLELRVPAWNAQLFLPDAR